MMGLDEFPCVQVAAVFQHIELGLCQVKKLKRIRMKAEGFKEGVNTSEIQALCQKTIYSVVAVSIVSVLSYSFVFASELAIGRCVVQQDSFSNCEGMTYGTFLSPCTGSTKGPVCCLVSSRSCPLGLETSEVPSASSSCFLHLQQLNSPDMQKSKKAQDCLCLNSRLAPCIVVIGHKPNRQVFSK